MPRLSTATGGPNAFHLLVFFPPQPMSLSDPAFFPPDPMHAIIPNELVRSDGFSLTTYLTEAFPELATLGADVFPDESTLLQASNLLIFVPPNPILEAQVLTVGAPLSDEPIRTGHELLLLQTDDLQYVAFFPSDPMLPLADSDLQPLG